MISLRSCFSEPPMDTITPCQPSPCGPNSVCRAVNGQSVCSCMPTYIGSPPGCRPECTVSSECAPDLACINQKCVNPCPKHCGLNTLCRVINHSPICTCSPSFIGDPFTRCYKERKCLRKVNTNTNFTSILTRYLQWLDFVFFSATVMQIPHQPFRNPCVPSPCGPHAVCREINDSPSCSCMQDFQGLPPNCRPECAINQDCPSNQACINMKCRDPCPGSCGQNADCTVFNHLPSCACSPGFTGDPFTSCAILPPIAGMFFTKLNNYIINQWNTMQVLKQIIHGLQMRYRKTHVIRHHVDIMLNAEMEYARALTSITEILISVANQNALRTWIVLLIMYALETNV